jgi:Na+-driven multidrug efflux pump
LLVYQYGVDYLTIVAGLSLGLFGQVTVERLMQSTGKTTLSMTTQLIGAIINMILDPLLILGIGPFPRLETKGAAIATVIGYCSTIIYAIWFYSIARKSSYHLELAKPDMKEIGGICFNGSSDMVSNLAEGITVLFMNHLAFRCYGEVGVSALTVVTYVQVLISMVFMGFTSAVEPVFSYHYGSGNVKMRQRVFRLSIRWIMTLGVATMLLLFLFRSQVVGIFFRKGTEFFDIASLGYLIVLPACLFTGFNVFGSGLFTAFGNGVVSGLLSLIRSFVILTCCLYGLTALFGGPGLWSAWPAAELLSILVTLYALKKYRGTYQY